MNCQQHLLFDPHLHLQCTTPLMQCYMCRAKCYPVMLGGRQEMRGLNSSSNGTKCCHRLTCSKCDLEVLSLPGRQWSHDADYLFFRTMCALPCIRCTLLCFIAHALGFRQVRLDRLLTGTRVITLPALAGTLMYPSWRPGPSGTTKLKPIAASAQESR